MREKGAGERALLKLLARFFRGAALPARVAQMFQCARLWRIYFGAQAHGCDETTTCCPALFAEIPSAGGSVSELCAYQNELVVELAVGELFVSARADFGA
jgi:hypothetical protein